MIQVSAILLILLIEGFVLMILLVGLLIFLMMRARKKRISAVMQLSEQLKTQSQVRRDQTGSFLQDIYQLEDAELKKAVNAIDVQEKQFFQKIIDIFYHNKLELVPTLDAALAALIDTYKSLKPKEIIRETGAAPEVVEELKTANAELMKSNAQLTEELAITKKTMDGMISEFGNMFGGGSNNELGKAEVVDKLESKDDVLEAARAKATAAKAADQIADVDEIILDSEALDPPD